LGRTAAETSEQDFGPAQQLIAYLECRKALEAQLLHEFPRAGRSRYQLVQLIVDESVTRNIDPWLTYSIIKLESRFRADAVGRAGEIGLMQVLPSTGRLVAERALGVSDYQKELLFEPEFNLRVGLTHFAYLLKVHEGKLADALTAYNAGHADVARRVYAQRVLEFYAEYQAVDEVDLARVASLFSR
jgi:soluble lytic murein transglycosylase-like protein